MQPEARTVRQVARYLRETIEHDPALGDLWIEGEIANLAVASSGHVYFSLKDEHATLQCAFFRSHNLPHRRKLENGALIIAHGAFSFYEPRGSLQLIVDFVEPAGTGALQAEYERRRQQFEAEGLFDPARKRRLPRFPRRIGVVTSEHGAAVHDILTVLQRRWPLAEVIVAPALVQGDGAAGSISAALRGIAPSDPEQCPDVIIVGRGGGAAEDLWAFNEEAVVRAIFACAAPVISAVGHETDVTLADLVADVRAPTPSAAAEIAVPDRAEVTRSVTMLLGNAEYALIRRVDQASDGIRRVRQHMARHLPETAALHRRVRQHAELMGLATLHSVSDARERTGMLTSQVQALSPHATLARGYALVSREDGSPAAAARDVGPGDAIDVRWRDGSRRARVESSS